MTASNDANDPSKPLDSSRAPTVVPSTGVKGAQPLSKDQRDDCIKEYARTGLWIHSCHRAGASQKAFNELRKVDPVFSFQVQEAKRLYNESLEGEAHRRAMEGEVEQRFDKQGNVVSERKVYSDRMLEVLMRGNMPEKYKDGVEVNVGVNVGVLRMPDGARPRTQEEFEAKHAASLAEVRAGLKKPGE